MELYLVVKPVGRGDKGRTACGSSAYRACDKVIDNAGNRHDFSRKSGYVTGGILLPAGAPAELMDRQTLWQRHDQKETRKDAQIFREVEVSLHNSLSYDAAAGVCIAIGQKLADMGMCVQWDIHDKTNKKGERNLHAHLMLSMRELLPDGTFGKKNRSWNMYNGGMNLADELRPFAAALMNAELDKIGVTDRVEYKSFVDRGIDRIPTVHVGVTGYALADQGILTYKMRLNKRIKEINAEHIAYIEKLEKYRAARSAFTEMALQNAEERRGGLYDLISAAEAVRTHTNARDALQEPIKTAREKTYESIKQINLQAAGLRKDKNRIKKIRQALYLVKNLAGDRNLNAEQNDQLNWASGYLKWAGIQDLSPEGVRKSIEQYREHNTDCCMQQIQLTQAKNQAYEDLRSIRDIAHQSKRRSIER